MGWGRDSKAPIAGGAGVLGAAAGFAAMRLTAPCVYLCYKSWRGGDPNAVVRRAILVELPTALRLGLACGFLVFVAARVWSNRRRDPVAVGAAAGMIWIMGSGFIEQLLYNLNFNIFSDLGNAFWAISYLIATASVLWYVAQKIAARATGEGTVPNRQG
jgi:hypothetical protein